MKTENQYQQPGLSAASALSALFATVALTACGGGGSAAPVAAPAAPLAACATGLVAGTLADLLPQFGGKTLSGNLYAPPTYAKGKAIAIVMAADAATGTLDGVGFTVSSVCYSTANDPQKTTALVAGSYAGGKTFSMAQFYVGAYTFAGTSYQGTVNDLVDANGADVRTGAWAK